MPPGEKIAQFADDIEYYNGTFLNKKNLNIHCYYWKPRVEPRALLHLSHGYAEHSSLYESIAKEMCRRGFFVFAHDHLGHGHSEGSRAYVQNIHDLVEDAVTHIQIIQRDYPELKVFMCGHSMGGSISVLTSIEKAVSLSGMVLIAPALAKNPETVGFITMTFAKILDTIYPRCPLIASDFTLITQCKEKAIAMAEDPLRYQGHWQVRPILALINGADEISKRVEEVQVPFLLLHGDNDKVCHIQGSKNFFEQSHSKDKFLKIYPGGYHSLLNEPDEIANDVFDQTIKWLEARA